MKWIGVYCGLMGIPSTAIVPKKVKLILTDSTIVGRSLILENDHSLGIASLLIVILQFQGFVS